MSRDSSGHEVSEPHHSEGKERAQDVPENLRLTRALVDQAKESSCSAVGATGWLGPLERWKCFWW